MRTILTEAEGFELLNPFFPEFIQVFNDSYKSLDESMKNDSSKGITKFTASYKAMAMWNYAINHTANIFGNHSDFKPVLINKIYGLNFNDALFIRFKKLTEKQHTSNIPTKQSLALVNQLEIQGFPSKPCILTVGYNMDRAFTQIIGINIVCEKGKTDHHWKYDILNQTETTKEINFAPFDEEVSDGIEKLLKIKEEKRKKKDKTGTQ